MGSPIDLAWRLLKEEVLGSDQHAKPGDPRFWDIMSHYGYFDEDAIDREFAPYPAQELTDLAPQVDELLASYGYTPYYFGGRYPLPDLNAKNYNTGHLAIFDPDVRTAGFTDAAFTDNWRKLHELGHALGLEDINAKWGEGRRMGKLGVRTPREMLRAVDWERAAMENQRKLMNEIGLQISPESSYNKDWNTTIGDAAYRAITGKFTSPEKEGFVPFNEKVPLEIAMRKVRERAEELGLDMDQTLRDKRAGARKVASEPMDIAFQLLKEESRGQLTNEDLFWGLLDEGDLMHYDEMNDKQRAIMDAKMALPAHLFSEGSEMGENMNRFLFSRSMHEKIPEHHYDDELEYLQHFNDAMQPFVNNYEKTLEIMNNGDEAHPEHPHNVAMSRMHPDFKNRMDTIYRLYKASGPMNIAMRLLKQQTFNDYFGIKDQWVSLPKAGMDQRPELYHEVAEAMNIAYAPIGGHAKYGNAGDLEEDDKLQRYDMIDNDDDPYVDAAKIYAPTDFGFKNIASAQDGRRTSKEALKNYTETTIGQTPGYYAEMSGPWEKFMTRRGIQPLQDMEQVRQVMRGKELTPTTAPGVYSRVIGNKVHEKGLYGTPLMEDGKEHVNAFMQQLNEAHERGEPFVFDRDLSNLGFVKVASEPMDIAMRLLKRELSPAARKHKLEYDTEYESTPERVKYREELNRERHRRGIYGSHNHKDVSHTEGNKLTLESEHDNRARHFKQRGTLREVVKSTKEDLELLRNLLQGPMDEQDKKIGQAMVEMLNERDEMQSGKEEKPTHHDYFTGVHL